MAVFDFKIKAEPSGQVLQRTLDAAFGDGYSQSAADGINTRSQVWNIEARGPWRVAGCSAGQPVKAIADFLDAHQGYKSFEWTPPASDERIRVECKAYSIQPAGNGIVTLSMVFQQVYR